jgi:hypothetical protein
LNEFGYNSTFLSRNSEGWTERYLERDSESMFRPGKVVVLYGARRVGKTALVKRLLTPREGRIFFSTGEDADLADILTSRRVETYQLFFGNYDVVCIDDASLILSIRCRWESSPPSTHLWICIGSTNPSFCMECTRRCFLIRNRLQRSNIRRTSAIAICIATYSLWRT